MKKKFLLIVSLVFVVCCLFAVSVSAEVVISDSNIDENGDVVADLICKCSDTEEQHIASIDITYTSKDGETKLGKFYYVVGLWSQQNKRQIEAIYLPSDFDMTQTVYFFDKIDINGNGEYGYNELVKGTRGGAFYIKSYTDFIDNNFEGAVDVKSTEVQAISYSKYLTYFGNNAFSKCAALNSVTYNGRELEEYTCIISPNVEQVMSGAFGGDGKSLDSNTVTSNFTRLIFEDRAGSVSFDQYCFTRNELKEIVFGSGRYALNGSDRIALQYKTENTSEYCLERVIVSKDTLIASGSISWYVGEYDVIVLGTESECSALYETNCKNALPNAKSVTFNPCYFGHTEAQDDGNCTTAVVCPACLTYIYKEASSHNNEETVTYGSYFEKGVHYVGCCNEGCTVGTTTELDALVTSAGYSSSTYGETRSVVQGFIINKEAIEFYSAYNKAFEIGVVALANATGEAVTPSFSDKKVVSGKISLVNSYVDVCVKGITDKIGEKRVVLCLYIIDDKGLNFLNEGKTEDSVRGISYSEILALNQKYNSDLKGGNGNQSHPVSIH